jgi:hypothetical protein
MNRRRVLTMTLASPLCASAVAIRSAGAAQAPLMVDGLVYANTPGHRVVAIGGVYVAFALPEGTTR